MPRRKPKAEELKTEDVLRKMFPKKAREEVQQTALDSQKKTTKRQSR